MPTPTAAKGCVTLAWCGGEAMGGCPGLTRILESDPVKPRRLGREIACPTPRRPPLQSHDGTRGAPPMAGGLCGISRPPFGAAHPSACTLSPTHSLCSCTAVYLARDGVRRHSGPPRPLTRGRGEGTRGRLTPFPTADSCSTDSE